MKNTMSFITSYLKLTFSLLFITLVFGIKLNAQTGSTCGSPLTIASLPFNQSGNTSSYGDNYTNADVPATAAGAVTNGTGSNYYITGDDVVFAYTPPCNEVITISTTNDNSWIGLWAFTGCPFNSTVGYHTATSGTTRQIPNLSVTGGITYYFVISSWPSPQSTNYTINITKISGCTTTATCSDGIQNQGETGIDCGGPCPACPTGCLNTSSYGSATAPTNTTSVTISSCNYQTEYSTISNIVAGNSYQLGNSCGGYVTVRSGTYNGTVVASGNSALTFTAPTSGTYYVHWNTNSSCGTASSCCTTTITCTSCGGATCSDGIQNQGETGIDCGGPCPACPTGPGLTPTACSNTTFTLTPSSSAHFYDDGGPGGNCSTDGAVGNFANAGCLTTTTICAAPGQYLIANFLVFSMFNTNSGFDWMVIYEGSNTSGTILFDNRSGSTNNPVGTDCTYDGTSLNFCSIGQCLTFQFNGTSVVNREGWDALVSSVPGFCTPLPIELLSFTGEAIEETNVLNWTTTSEINNDYFIVEASVDAENFKSIGIVAGAGNSNEVLNYQFIDNNPIAKTMYYRLKQVDFDGKWENSEIVAIERNSLGTIDIFPNPVNNLLHINFNNNENVVHKILITNILGEVISEINTLGKSKLTLDVFENLSGGVYFIKIMNKSNNLITTEKVIKN